MSQIQNVITTTFRARGNQAIAAMGQVAQGFGNVGRAINDVSRLSDRLNNQWRAIGTTIRYAIAGSAVFGLTRLAGQLRDVQQQLGLIAAIGSQPGGGIGGKSLSESQVTRLGDQLRKAAVDAIQPINEVNDATVNYLSTVQNVRPSELPSIITDIGRSAKLAQTPVEDMTKAATTMNIAFGRVNNLRTIQEFNRQFFALTTLAPGGKRAGHEITQQLGPLSSLFALGRGPGTGAQSQTQLMSLVLASLRFGGTPATSIRGLQFLTQSIIQPATPAARKALAGIGITPQSIQEQGVYANLMKFLQHIRFQGNVRKVAGLDDEALAGIEESGGTLPGIPANQMPFLRTAIGRIHGIRTAVILAEQLKARGGVQSLQQDLQIMQGAQADTLADALNMREAWERFRRRAQLQEASVAINAMGLQVAQIFEPVLNFAGGRVTGLQGVMQRHPTATRNAVLGGGAFLAALGIGRFLGVGKLLPAGLRNSAIGRLLGGASLGQGLVMANAAAAAMSGATGLGATPQNPLYVVVVGQLFGGGTAAPVAGGGGGRGIGFGFGGLIGRGVRAVGGAAARVAGRYGARGIRFGGRVLGPAAVIADYFMNPDVAGGAEVNWAQNLQAARSMYGPNVTNAYAFNQGKFQGRAEVFMTIDIQHPGGKIERRRVHVPMTMWQGGRVPTTQGNAGNTRRSG